MAASTDYPDSWVLAFIAATDNTDIKVLSLKNAEDIILLDSKAFTVIRDTSLVDYELKVGKMLVTH